jgi:DNA-binding LytR/AlgR family response regulator
MHIRQTGFLELAGATTSPVQALQMVFEQKADAVFLDVLMPEMSGIEFMQLLNGKCKVILVTAYKDYAIEGFDNDVVDYLLKPVTFPRFLKSARKLLATQENSRAPENDYILVSSDIKGKLLRINIDDIIYVEGQKQYVRFYTRQGKQFLSLISLKELETRMPNGKFVRVHKSYLLATQYISMIQHNMVYMEHSTKIIPIGPIYREGFMNRVKDKIIT